MTLQHRNSTFRLLSQYDTLGDVGADAIQSRSLVRNIYSGDFGQMFRRASQDLGESIVSITGVPGEDPVRRSWGRLAKIYQDYWYQPVGASQVLADLGYIPTDPIDFFSRLLVDLSAEDPTIAALRMGMEVTRADYERVYVDLAVRAMESERANNRNNSGGPDK